jgi:hypothetical protein
MSPVERGGRAAVSQQARRVTGNAKEEKIIMRIPQQVAERVKEAPAQALRTVFSGIGQVLLVADRIKNRGTEPERAQAAAAAPRAGSSPGQAAAKDETRWRSLDETGNVRLLSEEDRPDVKLATEAVTEPAVERPAAAEPPAAEPPTVETVMESPAAEAVAESPAMEQAALPVPSYDDLTVASLRARLRNLDQSQVRALLDYEKAHAGRTDVLTMFERRIAKLDSGQA